VSWVVPLVAALTLIGVAVGRVPGLRMNRATIALVGAVAMVAVGALSPAEAFGAVDLPTLGLLLGMMILNANLRLAGFFDWLAARVGRVPRRPAALLALLMTTAGTLSALLLNDTVVLLMTPLVIEIARAARRDPVPYLIGLATAANLGSVATILGNPQNMMIGLASAIPFSEFARSLAPVAAGGLALGWLVLLVLYRSQLRTPWPSAAAAGGPLQRPRRVLQARPRRVHRPLLRKSAAALVLLVACAFAGVPLPLAALGAAALLLVTRRLRPERVFREIDWSLLVFFAGLFVVTAGLERSAAAASFFELMRPWLERGDLAFAGVAALLSNLVSNVPAVMLLGPLMPSLPDPGRAWLLLAMATTFAGNLTLLGSVANLIVAESARARRVELSFAEYLRAGVPITLLSLAWGCFWL
jgi:Na+/H+ antiporter NhaD/arsenite permease-like protein